MSTATLPTRRDEAWRYADMDAVARLGVVALDQWQTINVAAGESVTRCMIVGSDAPELHRFRVSLGEGAKAAFFVTNRGGDYTRVDLEIRLAKGAHFEFGGVTIGGGSATREFVTQVIHAEPDATSNQTVRAVHWGTGTGNFLGEIKVARHAQKTDAAQDFKALLLEAGASANAVPQLEIFADDVKCAHGATVGELDEAARFYMMARGVDPATAQRLLVQAFIGDAFVSLDDEAERETLLDAALSALEGARL
ncbi:Fe-S cluster assembly protein SufD [Erythromicrobium ramosum]|uniref:Fe-S cluster assembly protein SufD n=1 Tax=Erythrobacter ramosus TaxID=35811 RepID=A0A6I4UJQ5_9SPHN|nr:SufD family Fe-S cluster assembly protein [Erythrobacter ramosus]MBB3774523.1 Fe-S cluster assembly protein SufD [Erythrobacter ramosus]MXP37827.1 SufD family Fe-S cluster assembly protein [Erythrobacter ramosus]